jgi:hypothetical protein
MLERAGNLHPLREEDTRFGGGRNLRLPPGEEITNRVGVAKDNDKGPYRRSEGLKCLLGDIGSYDNGVPPKRNIKLFARKVRAEAANGLGERLSIKPGGLTDLPRVKQGKAFTVDPVKLTGELADASGSVSGVGGETVEARLVGESGDLEASDTLGVARNRLSWGTVGHELVLEPPNALSARGLIFIRGSSREAHFTLSST